MQLSSQNNKLQFQASNQGKTPTLQEFTLIRQKLQTNSLPLSNQNFPKPTNHIPRVDFSRTWGQCNVKRQFI